MQHRPAVSSVDRHIIEGRCHCGNIGFELELPYSAEQLVVRACQCHFCRLHGAATAREPRGSARITARDPSALTLYRFATGTTDFVLCAICGAYLGAVIEQRGRRYATLNMRMSELELGEVEPIVYGDEPADQRAARRVELFTPVAECPF